MRDNAINKFGLENDFKRGKIKENKIIEEITNNDKIELHESPEKSRISLNKLKKKEFPNKKNNLLEDMYKQINDYGLMIKNTNYAQKADNNILDEISQSHMPLNYTPRGYFDRILSKSNEAKAKIQPLESKKPLFAPKSMNNIKIEPLQEKSNIIESFSDLKLTSNRRGKLKGHLSSRNFMLFNEISPSNILKNNLSSSSQFSTKESMKIFDRKVVIMQDFGTIPQENNEFNDDKIFNVTNKLQLQFPIASIH